MLKDVQLMLKDVQLMGKLQKGLPGKRPQAKRPITKKPPAKRPQAKRPPAKRPPAKKPPFNKGLLSDLLRMNVWSYWSLSKCYSWYLRHWFQFSFYKKISFHLLLNI